MHNGATGSNASTIGIEALGEFWRDRMAGQSVCRWRADRDLALMNALGIGLHQCLVFLYGQRPSFADFERWIVATAGLPVEATVSRFNAAMDAAKMSREVQRQLAQITAAAPVLTPEALQHWQARGYLVLRQAISKAQADVAAEAVWHTLQASPNDADSWYGRANGIMVELIQHPALRAIRGSARIRKAFSQLWGSADLWPSADRCSFHPPQRPGWPFPGPDLHWDLDLSQPLRFATQGLVYLTDTPPEQGALTLVPGFQHRLADWLAALPAGVDPQQQDLHELGSIPVPAQAGDMVIWHAALPHGSRPNLGRMPRLVQYLNLAPIDIDAAQSSLGVAAGGFS
ncbi:phytanoyl-CoA dioxygenase family protein [Ferrimonas pelagia]|uniref:Phytanoyl-CoA dioxygenase n=1 Tax=Ferrimonas pelagia TaxID=1177826 RepID=A0ABP9EDC9_9GAMM